jgi:hypothetical protein
MVVAARRSVRCSFKGGSAGMRVAMSVRVRSLVIAEPLAYSALPAREGGGCEERRGEGGREGGNQGRSESERACVRGCVRGTVCVAESTDKPLARYAGSYIYYVCVCVCVCVCTYTQIYVYILRILLHIWDKPLARCASYITTHLGQTILLQIWDKPLARCASSVAVLIAMFIVKSCALGSGDALIASTSAESRGVANIWIKDLVFRVRV